MEIAENARPLGKTGPGNGCESSSAREEPMDEDESDMSDNPLFSNRSIAVIASTIGISDLPEEVCRHIAEELYYKTKQLVYMSKVILDQNKSSLLTTNDVKKAMRLLGGIEVYGHSTNDEVSYEHVPEEDIYVEKDTEIEFGEDMISDCYFPCKREPHIHGEWILPEGYTEDKSNLTPSPYFQKVSSVILNGNPAHLKVALSDLRTNPKIGPICPYFLNLVAITVKNIPRDVHLTNALIGTVHAIAHNRFVDPSPYPAANKAVNSLLKIVIEANIERVNDEYVDTDEDLTVRIRAALLLAKVIVMWSIELKPQISMIKLILQHLMNPKVPLQSHYGAIVALTTLGHRRLDYFLPVVIRFLLSLEVKIENKKNEIMVRHIMIAILVAARNVFKKEQGSNIEQLKQLYTVDKMLYSYFGDSLTPLRLVATPPIFKCEKGTGPQQSRLKLQIRFPRTKNVALNWRNKYGDQIFTHSEVNDGQTDISNREGMCIDNQPYASKSAYEPLKRPYYCVKRNIKFCRPQHERSAAGDLLLIL